MNHMLLHSRYQHGVFMMCGFHSIRAAFSQCNTRVCEFVGEAIDHEDTVGGGGVEVLPIFVEG